MSAAPKFLALPLIDGQLNGELPTDVGVCGIDIWRLVGCCFLSHSPGRGNPWVRNSKSPPQAGVGIHE